MNYTQRRLEDKLDNLECWNYLSDLSKGQLKSFIIAEIHQAEQEAVEEERERIKKEFNKLKCPQCGIWYSKCVALSSIINITTPQEK